MILALLVSTGEWLQIVALILSGLTVATPIIRKPVVQEVKVAAKSTAKTVRHPVKTLKRL